MAEEPLKKPDLQRALKDAGLPYGYLFILKMEKRGILPKVSRKGKIRYYTRDEINDCIKRILEYRSR